MSPCCAIIVNTSMPLLVYGVHQLDSIGCIHIDTPSHTPKKYVEKHLNHQCFDAGTSYIDEKAQFFLSFLDGSKYTHISSSKLKREILEQEALRNRFIWFYIKYILFVPKSIKESIAIRRKCVWALCYSIKFDQRPMFYSFLFLIEVMIVSPGSVVS